MKLRRFVISLEEEPREKLRVLAFHKRTSIAEEIRKAIEEYLRKENDKE